MYYRHPRTPQHRADKVLESQGAYLGVFARPLAITVVYQMMVCCACPQRFCMHQETIRMT